MGSRENFAKPAIEEPIVPGTLPRSMVWVLVGCLLALAVLPWAIPSLILRIITP
jgi:hypothetical protein